MQFYIFYDHFIG